MTTASVVLRRELHTFRIQLQEVSVDIQKHLFSGVAFFLMNETDDPTW